MPVLNLPGPLTVSIVSPNVDADVAISSPDLIISDSNAGAGGMEVTLGVEQGTLAVTLPGGNTTSVTGNNSPTLTLTGSLSEINAVLTASNAIMYDSLANYIGPDMLTLSAENLDNTLIGTATLPITVADSTGAVPDVTVGVPAPLQVPEAMLPQ